MYLEITDPCTLHFRYFDDPVDGTKVTEVLVHHGQCREKGCGRGEMGVGAAFCVPADPFVRRVGRKLALSRALRGLPKPTRKEIWEKYLELAPRSKG